MTPGDASMLLDLLVAGALVVLAASALFSVQLFRAAVLFIVYGLVLSLAWVRLGAPDVALAEAAIGAGLSGALLLAAIRQVMRGAVAAGATHGGRDG